MAAPESWLIQVSVNIGQATADPIRTSVHFLAALPRDQQRATLRYYLDVTRASSEELERKANFDASTQFERSEKLGTLGALAEVRARNSWLREVEHALALT